MLLIIAILLCIFLIFYVIVIDYNKRKCIEKQLKNIQIISKIPIVGSMLALVSFRPDNLHIKFKEYCEKFGKTFYARVLGSTIIVTAEKQYVKKILSSHKHIHKHMIYYLLRPWLGDGLLLSTEKKWHKMRKIITPTFHFQILEEFIEIFDIQSKILANKLQSYADGETIVNIYPFMGLATMDIIAQTTMGVHINAQSSTKSDFVNSVQWVTNILAKRFVRPLLAIPILFRILSPKMFKQQTLGIEVMHSFTNSVIEERRQKLENQLLKLELMATLNEKDTEKTKRRALLDLLLLSEKSLTDKEIQDEVNTIMFEGHDTTTSAISFCLYLLSRNPISQRKLYEEIQEYFSSETECVIVYKDLQNLRYLNCVVKEALRLYPPIPAIGRLLKEDLNFDDIIFPAETNVIILLWQILRDPEEFPEPESFRPERFYAIENSTIDDMHSFSYIPFSAGPRNCIGQRFALLEIKTVIIRILMRYELLPLGDEIQPSIHIVLRSKNGVNLGLRERFACK